MPAVTTTRSILDATITAPMASGNWAFIQAPFKG